MVSEDVLGVDRLAVARDGVHAVDGHAVADGRERIAGEVQVRHGSDDHLGGLADEIDQGVRLVGVKLGEVDALHRLHDQVEVIGVVLLHIVEDDLLVAVGADTGLFDPLLEELLAQFGFLIEDFGHELLEVHDLHAVVAQNLRESVVLLLSDLQKRDVVEQQLFERVRRQVQKLSTRAVEKNFFQGLDLALDVQTSHSNPPFPLCIFQILGLRKRPLRTGRPFTSPKSHGSDQIATTKTKQNGTPRHTSWFFGEWSSPSRVLFTVSSYLLYCDKVLKWLLKLVFRAGTPHRRTLGVHI